MAIDEDTITELGAAPKRVTGDEGTVEERSIDEVIKADQYAAAKQATLPGYGLRIARLQKPGTP